MSVSAFQQHLKSLGACSDAREWSKDLTATQTWETCERPDWLLWWAARTSANSKQEIAAYAAYATDAAAYARKEMKAECCKIIRETLKQPWTEN